MADTAIARAKAPRRKVRRLSVADRVTVTLMVVVPSIVVLGLIWLPALASVFLSFTNWNGVGSLGGNNIVGLENYTNIATNYPPFWPAIRHNLIWLAVMFLIATPIGMFLAVLLDKQLRGGRIYQTALYLPVVLSWL